MSDKPDPVDPERQTESEEERFARLDGCWEALQRGESIEPVDMAQRADLRLVRTLHDALQMVRADSQIGPVNPDATAPFPPTVREPGVSAPGSPAARRVGGYRLLRRLGGGGMGEVFEAEDAATGQRVALKLLAPHFDATEENVERFRREGRLASTITHPRCVFVLAADEEAGQPYIVMELMPGDTLKDLVERHGPLAPAQAVRTILDVIDGLQAAHALQVLHRDVKPSNCFLEADGRVKVGDFGLSKSLSGDASLTAAGTFLGTVHYASPEQFKGPAGVDLRTDVYAVAATLYYLLTGQPPFPDPVPTAVLMRKASEPAPPLRPLRPEISPALERVVLRGLERDRERRWRDLGEFRQALLPFLPGHLSAGGLGMRVGALFIDVATLGLLAPIAMAFLFRWTTMVLPPVFEFFWSPITGLIYFVLLEGVWGCSLGKRLLRLRVCTARGTDPGGLGRVLLRTLIFLGLWLVGLVIADNGELWRGETALLGLLSFPLGILLVVSTMRARNGYRGPHEFLSGTRVVQLPWPEEGAALSCSQDWLAQLLVRPDALPQRVGPFVIRGALSWEPGMQILLGEDEALRRSVWIHLHTEAAAPANMVRREVRRPARLRWLGGGRHEDQHWDAFLAPSGCPLEDAVAAQGSLAWRDTRGLLEQLADVLVAAQRDGTLPGTLTMAQVWVTQDGRVQLLDYPPAALVSATDEPPGGSLSLLRQVATLALEGQSRRQDAPAYSVCAPLPLHASRLLDRLLGVRQPFADVAQAQAELAAACRRPATVTSEMRAAHLAVQGALLFPGLLFLFILGHIATLVQLEYIDEDIRRATVWRSILNNDTFAADLDRGGITDLPQARERIRARLEHQQEQRALRRRFLKYTLEVLLPDLGKMRSDAADVQPEVKLKRLESDPLTVSASWPDDLGEAAERTFTIQDLRLKFLSPSLRSSEAPLIADLEIVVSLILIGFFPLVWVLWSFVFRGGITLRLMGQVLVGPNGRKAGRIQCAWRTLLVWFPVVALLLASARLEFLSWRERTSAEPILWLGWLSVACWWLAVGLLAAYFLLAFRQPGRSLHDRLAGTYLVPR